MRYGSNQKGLREFYYRLEYTSDACGEEERVDYGSCRKLKTDKEEEKRYGTHRNF
ncbi:hypothetical protein ID0444_14140 [Helicobacter pylori]